MATIDYAGAGQMRVRVVLDEGLARRALPTVRDGLHLGVQLYPKPGVETGGRGGTDKAVHNQYTFHICVLYLVVESVTVGARRQLAMIPSSEIAPQPYGMSVAFSAPTTWGPQVSNTQESAHGID
jgi:hypothetical protein